MRLFLLLASLAIVGCQQVPVTGRSQFILVDEGEVAALSATEFAKMKKLPADPRLPKLREIGLKIVAAARRDDKAGVLPPACSPLRSCSLARSRKKRSGCSAGNGALASPHTKSDEPSHRRCSSLLSSASSNGSPAKREPACRASSAPMECTSSAAGEDDR